MDEKAQKVWTLFDLGTRRDWRFYSEHLFVNLIWGLEALHRKKQLNNSGSETKDRVTRIIKSIDDDKDKRWLTRILKNAHEPNLERRLLEIMELVSINIDRDKLRQFGTRCAQIRNDIFHFGEQRNGLFYDDFIKEVTHKARALSTLYHMIILHEIGIDKETINDWIYVRSSSARATLVEGGLLDKQATPPRQG